MTETWGPINFCTLEVCLSAVQEDDDHDQNDADNSSDVDFGDIDQVESMALDSISQTASTAFTHDDVAVLNDASMPTATVHLLGRRQSPNATAKPNSKHTTFLQAFMNLDTDKLLAIQRLSLNMLGQGSQPTIAGQDDQSLPSPGNMASTASLHSSSSPTDRMLHYLTEIHHLDRQAHHIIIKTNWSYCHLGCAYVDFCKVRPLHPTSISSSSLVRSS
jgi:hypothetical protein